jgi:hypothetical protein
MYVIRSFFYIVSFSFALAASFHNELLAQTEHLNAKSVLQSSLSSDEEQLKNLNRYKVIGQQPGKPKFEYLPVKPKSRFQKVRKPASETETANTTAETKPTVPLELSKGDESPPIEKKPEEASSTDISDHLLLVVQGRGTEAYQNYANEISAEDRRLNRIEMKLSSGFVYNSSKANYSYRNYDAGSHMFGLEGAVWLTPLVGIDLSYDSTLNGDLQGFNGAKVAAKQDWTKFNFVGRHFFSSSIDATSIEAGLFFSENRMSVPSDEKLRANLKSSGIGARAKLTVPTSAKFAWNYGFEIMPRVSHTEGSSGINLMSGTGADSSRIGISIGNQWNYSRHGQFFWDLSLSSEKNLFTGSANLTDPESGQTPNGVSVNNTWTIFRIGYGWGK